MSRKLTPEELSSLLAMGGPADAFEDVEVAEGVVIPVRGVTAREYVEHVVRKSPYLLARYSISTKNTRKIFVAMRDAETEALAAGKAFDRDKWFAENGFAALEDKDLLEGVEISMRHASEVDILFLAAAMGSPGDKHVMTALKNASEDRIEKLLEVAQRKTWGDDPAPFFEKIDALVMGRDPKPKSKTLSTEQPTTASSRS